MATRHISQCDCGWTSNATRSEKQAAFALRQHSCAKHLAKVEAAKRGLAKEAAVDRTPKPCLHKRVTHDHGTHACYVLDRCRCRPCADANTAYERTRSRRHAYGRFGNDWVDAQPARDHVRQLMAAGMGLKRIVEVSGYSQGAMTRLIYGSRERGMVPTKRISAQNAAAILAVRATLDTLADGARVDNTGTVRRLQALMVNGWSQSKLARRIGFEVRNFNYLLHGQRAVTVGTAKKVRDLYEELWDQQPPRDSTGHRGAYTRATRYAATRGWLPPLAWDDDTIDDPTATPFDEAPAVGVKRLHIEDVEFLLDDQPLATSQQIADRLHVSKDTVQQACRRAGRTDLLERLARNAELRGAAA
jgi:transcriptional regulator with XRE-family HTH domain